MGAAASDLHCMSLSFEGESPTSKAMSGKEARLDAQAGISGAAGEAPQSKEERKKAFADKVNSLDENSRGKFHEYDLAVSIGKTDEIKSRMALDFARTSASESQAFLDSMAAPAEAKAALVVELPHSAEDQAERSLQVVRRMAQDLLMVPRREPLPFLIESRIMTVPLEDGKKVCRGVLFFRRDLSHMLKECSGGKLDLTEVIKELSVEITSPYSSDDLKDAYNGLLATNDGFTEAGMEQLSEIYSKTQQLCHDGVASEDMQEIGEMSLTEWFEFAAEQCEGEDREGFESFILGAHEEVETGYVKPDDLLVHEASMASIKIKANVERTIMDALGVLFPKGMRAATQFEGGSCNFRLSPLEQILENFNPRRRAIYQRPLWDWLSKGCTNLSAVGKKKVAKRFSASKEALRQPLKSVTAIRLVCQDFRLDLETQDMDAIRILQNLPFQEDGTGTK